jgi:hypothetical protein
MRVLKRVLTRKSILGYGYAEVRDLSVQMILDLGKGNILINSYFGLEKIDFTEDILDELGITSEYRIVKPSKDHELCKLFFKNRTYNLSDEQRIKFWRKNNGDRKQDLIRKNASRISGRAEFLRSKNHGNR